jgi:hypothetical protein
MGLQVFLAAHEGVLSIVSIFKNIFENVGLNSSFQIFSSRHSMIKVNSRFSWATTPKVE